MKLIVDIPNDVYERVKNTKTIETTDFDIVSLYRATKNGTPSKRPQGEWIKTDGNSFECSVCHRLFDFGDNYCGFCGAKMRV